MSAAAVVVKVELEGLAAGFTSECYAYVKPADFDVMQEQFKIDPQTAKDEDIIAFQQSTVEKNFVAGRLAKFNGSDFEIVDMTSDDLKPAIISNKLYASIIGFDLDPKVSGKEVESTTLPQTSSDTTETPSSEA